MLLLSVDTCDALGGIAVVKDYAVLATLSHTPGEEYSSWLIPAVNKLLGSLGVSHYDLDGYAAAAGPGSFTGVRVGLTTVKAWSEVFGKPIVAVSRLEALASESSSKASLIAAFADAQRDQVFGGLYRRGEGLDLVGEECVAPPESFFDWVSSTVGDDVVAWISPDAKIVSRLDGWSARRARGEIIEDFPGLLASRIALLGASKLAKRQVTDALGLDANYVRRSDAELFWKKSAAT